MTLCAVPGSLENRITFHTSLDVLWQSVDVEIVEVNGA